MTLKYNLSSELLKEFLMQSFSSYSRDSRMEPGSVLKQKKSPTTDSNQQPDLRTLVEKTATGLTVQWLLLMESGQSCSSWEWIPKDTSHALEGKWWCCPLSGSNISRCRWRQEKPVSRDTQKQLIRKASQMRHCRRVLAAFQSPVPSWSLATLLSLLPWAVPLCL